MTGLPYYPPAPPVPSAAPAWRWHGYGAVIVSENLPPLTPQLGSQPATSTTPAAPNTPAATNGSAVSALPAAPDASQSTDWKQPGAVPAFTTPTDVAPAALPPNAVEPRPLTSGDSRWRATGEQVTMMNPMSTGSEPFVSMTRPAAAPVVTVSASVPVHHGPSVTLDPPRAMPPMLAAPVPMPPPPPIIQPVAYTAPAPAPRLTTIPSNIRPGIERVCAGRGRDLDVSVCGPSSLLVRLRVRQPGDAEYLANAISRMPELAPYQVQFEMQVAR
jgi:hypothetical protein